MMAGPGSASDRVVRRIEAGLKAAGLRVRLTVSYDAESDEATVAVRDVMAHVSAKGIVVERLDDARDGTVEIARLPVTAETDAAKHVALHLVGAVVSKAVEAAP
jgi:hypothetical protein